MENSMKKLSQSFLVGLSILLPVVLSVQLVIWTFRTIESWLKPAWLIILPEQYYFPGIAVLSFIVLATLIGVSSRLSSAKQIWKLPGNLLERTPVVNLIYNTIKDFFNLMGGKTFSEQSVVWVKLSDSDARVMGIVTKQAKDPDSKLSQLMSDDEVAVYLPMSYNAGGYMLVVPSSQIEKANIEPGEALRLIMSAGLGQRAIKNSEAKA